MLKPGPTTSFPQRSDSQKRTPTSDPVSKEVKRKLARSPYAAIRLLETSYHEGVVILRGVVPTYYTRQMAQALVRSVKGVEQIDDRISVWRQSSIQPNSNMDG